MQSEPSSFHPSSLIPHPSAERLDSLMVRYEELLAQGEPVSAEELCRDCPELRDAFQQQLVVRAQMNVLLDHSAGDENSGSTLPPEASGSVADLSAPAEPLATASRYRLLRRHASGG